MMDPNINVEEHFKLNSHANGASEELDATSNDTQQAKSSQPQDLSQYGVSIDELYQMGRNFVKEKEGKAVHLSYHDRNMLTVLAKQVHYGKFQEEANQNVGFLDLVGKDRLQLWKTLGDLSREEAMQRYIAHLLTISPLFHTFMEAHKRHLEEELRKKKIEEQNQLLKMAQQKERKYKEEEFKYQEDNKKKREEVQRKQIQEALNQQTFPHFKAYAEQQHPNNVSAQQELIKQLQEQHFEQYMNQVYQQQLMHQQQQAEQLKAIRQAQKTQKKQEQQKTAIMTNFSEMNLNEQHAETDTVNTSLTTADTTNQINASSVENTSTNMSNVDLSDSKGNAERSVVGAAAATDNADESNDEVELPPISAATMLTRQDIKEFKELVRKDNDSIIKVGSGETVTVRVPTHEDGRLLFWEFATDYYDIGFGLYFEWTISPSNNVTVHVSDSSDDEDGDEDESGEKKADLEKGKAQSNKPPCDEIIPIFRRDCHQEVYAGSHSYPGRGVYLLKFDNSYSLWRSKTLYYRVYYSK